MLYGEELLNIVCVNEQILTEGKRNHFPPKCIKYTPGVLVVCFSSVRVFIKIIEVKEEEEESIMDPRAYATLFPRERFETFVSAPIPLRPPPDAQEQQQQAADSNTTTTSFQQSCRPIGRARQFAFGFAGLARADDDDEEGGASVLVHLMPPAGKRSKSALSSFRKTTVLCASSLQSAFKNPRKPEEGFVEVRVDIASCSRAENTKNNADVVERAATIARVIRETVFPSRGGGGKGKGGLIDRSVLKGDGLEGDKCWKFIVECLVLDDDMGTMDACLAAVVACARKTRAPSILAGGDNAKGKGKKRQMLAVNRNFKPVCLTVGAFNLSTTENTDPGEKKKNIGDGSEKRKMNEEGEDEKVGDEDEIEDYEPPKQIVIVDPTYEETKLCDALINVIVDENGNVLGLEKSHHGASEVDETVLAKAIAAAKLRHGEVWKRIEQFDEMEEDEEDDDEEEDE